MTLKECLDWLAAAGDDSGHDAPKLAALLRALDPEGRGLWEIGLDSEAPARRRLLRARGAGSHAGFLTLAGRKLGGSWEGGEPSPGWPWLSLSWDAEADRLERARAVLAGTTRSGARAVGTDGAALQLSAEPYAAAVAATPELGELLGPFDRLHPLETVVTASEAWGVRLLEPAPWPRFMRLDLSKPFTEASTRLSYLALNRRVAELELEGGRMTAWLRA